MADLKKTEEQLKRIQDLYDTLGRENPFKGMDASNIASSTKEAERLRVALRGVEAEADNLNQSFSDLQSQLEATINEIKKGPSNTDKFAKGFKGVLAEVKKLKYEEEGINNLSISQLQTLKKKASQRTSDASTAAKALLKESGLQGMINVEVDKRTKEYKSLTDAQKTAIAFLNNEDETIQSINNKIKKRIEFEEKVIKNLGVTGGLLKGANGLMNKLGLGALSSAINFGKITEETEEYARSLEEGGENFVKGMTPAEKQQKVMAKGFKGMAQAIKKGLNDPLVTGALGLKGMLFVFNKLKEGFLNFDKQTSSLAKGLNISADQATNLNKQFALASKGSGQLFVSNTGLIETLNEINSELGTSVVLNQEQINTMTKLKKTAGLTGEEMMGIQKLSLANGKSFDENANTLLNQVSASNKANGIYLNEKTILKDISNLSAATTLSLNKNPKALAAAVSTAKSLGMEMSKVESIANSLLDFESSIENELQAELLLGKNINLEKARQAALNNDLATVAEEIAKQAGSASEFGKMNAIQQDNLAKAVGMNREELAKTLFVQEQLAGASSNEAARRQELLNARIAEVGLAQAQKEEQEGGLENLLNQATASEKLNASMEQFGTSLQTIGALFAPVVNLFAKMAAFISESKVATVAFGAALGALGAIATVMAVKSMITAVTSIFSSFAQIPFGLGIPAAIGTVATLGGLIGGVGSMIASAGDLNSPADGKTQISTKEGGLFELSPNDDIVAAPGASAAMARATQPQQTTVVQNDNTESKETNALLRQILSKQGTIKLDSTDMGTAMSVNRYAIQ